jgi:hypothetical protein
LLLKQSALIVVMREGENTLAPLNQGMPAARSSALLKPAVTTLPSEYTTEPAHRPPLVRRFGSFSSRTEDVERPS